MRDSKFNIEREASKYRELYHPLDDYSGDDYEAAENNLNDDILSFIEDNW